MRFASTLVTLGCLLSIAVAKSSDKSIPAQTAPTSARDVLEQMSPTERKNSYVSVEFESLDGEAVFLGREVERLWNGGQYDGALAQLRDLEARVGQVAIGNSWRKPVPTLATDFWGRDVRIGNRDSLLDVALDVHNPSGNLFAVLRHNAAPPHFSVCMSTDGGWTWGETFTWSGSPPASTDGTVLGNHFYVVYNSPGENAQELRLRRYLCSDGSPDTFRIGGTFVAPCTLALGDTMREVSLVSNQNNNQFHLVTLVSDGSVLVSYDDANAVSWTRRSTGITSGARSGLDATADQRSDMTQLFFSYCDTSDTMRVRDGNGQRLAQPAGTGTMTSISAYLDAVICAYEDETSSPHRVRYASSFDGGDTWTVSTLSDSGIAADAPAVTVSGGRGFAAVYRSSTPATELLFCQRTDSGSWSDPVSIAENGPSDSRPGIVCLGAGVYGVAYLSDASPVVRGAYFDRSDWVYGIAEQRQPQATSHKPQATVVSGVLRLSIDDCRMSNGELLNIGGRKVMELHAGANDVRALAPGVYFVVEPRTTNQELRTTTKVVVTK